jgi:TolB-like protein/DNA-binding winged helix-turn-helix (wHTH) protein
MSNTEQPQPVFRFGEFTLDTARGVLLRSDEEVSLRPQSLFVLQVLLERHGQLVTKDELYERVWSGKAVTDDSLTQCVADIRRALQDTDRTLLRTLPRRGLLFDGDVSIQQPTSDFSNISYSSRIRKAAVLAGLLIAVWLGWMNWSAPHSVPSIAVLPLINMSAVPDNSHFGEGVHEELLTNLSRIDDLRVISRTTMMRYLTLSRSTREIARELDVQYVVEGSVRRIGNHVRITVQLVDAFEDAHLWARNYDRELIDVFGTQSEVARDITNSIKLQIIPDSIGMLEEMPTKSVKAYDLFIRANSIHRGEAISEDAYRRQRELLEAAVAEDPDFVEAWARLNEHLDEIARTIVQDGWFGETRADRDAYFAQTRKAAKRALDRAVALDPDHVATLVALGSDPISEFEDIEFRVGRKQYLDRALDLDPNNGWIWYTLGWWGWDAGKVDEATAAIHKALELDPFHAHIVGGSLSYFALIGDREMAALLDERYAVIGPEQTRDGLFADMPNGVARMPSGVKLKNLYNLFLYTAEERMIGTLSETYTVEVENFIGTEGESETLDFWKAILLIVQDDVDGLLAFDLPQTPEDASSREVMHDITLHNMVLAAQRLAGQSDAASVTSRRILALRALLDVEPFTEAGFQAAAATSLAIKTLGDEGRIRKTHEFLRDHESFPELMSFPWPIVAYSRFDLDGAVEILLDSKAARPMWNGTDVIAAHHITNRELLLHPDMQAFFVEEGKWIDYLAARVPEYAQFRH